MTQVWGTINTVTTRDYNDKNILFPPINFHRSRGNDKKKTNEKQKKYSQKGKTIRVPSNINRKQQIKEGGINDGQLESSFTHKIITHTRTDIQTLTSISIYRSLSVRFLFFPFFLHLPFFFPLYFSPLSAPPPPFLGQRLPDATLLSETSLGIPLPQLL